MFAEIVIGFPDSRAAEPRLHNSMKVYWSTEQVCAVPMERTGQVGVWLSCSFPRVCCRDLEECMIRRRNWTAFVSVVVGLGGCTVEDTVAGGSGGTATAGAAAAATPGASSGAAVTSNTATGQAPVMMMSGQSAAPATAAPGVGAAAAGANAMSDESAGLPVAGSGAMATAVATAPVGSAPLGMAQDADCDLNGLSGAPGPRLVLELHDDLSHAAAHSGFETRATPSTPPAPLLHASRRAHQRPESGRRVSSSASCATTR